MNRVLKYITGRRIRSSLRQTLSIAGAFYLINVSYSTELILHLNTLRFGSRDIVKFLIAYSAIIFLFYGVLDFFLRYVFLKLIKKKVITAMRVFKRQRRLEALRELSEYKRRTVQFMLDYPIEMGYLKRTEITRVDEIKPSDAEKEAAIAELVPQMIKWACTVLHLLVTLIVVYKLYPILMTCFLAAGAFLLVILVSGLIVFIENVEVLPIILNEVHTRTLGRTKNRMYFLRKTC